MTPDDYRRAVAEAPALPRDATDRIRRAWARAIMAHAVSRRGKTCPALDYVYWDEPPPELFRLTSWPVRLALVTP